MTGFKRRDAPSMLTNSPASRSLEISSFVGVVSDSHMDRRTAALPSGVKNILRGAGLILHAGDITKPFVLEMLGEIAPVIAVRGNKDLFFPRLPLQVDLLINQVPVTLTHSHGGMLGYLYQWFIFFTKGYTHELHHARVLQRHQDSKVIVFGHTHLPYCQWHGNTLLFNPGSLGPAYLPKGSGPKVGRLYFEDGKVDGEILEVKSGKIQEIFP